MSGPWASPAAAALRSSIRTGIWWEEERGRVVYLNAPDRTQPYGYNPLRHVREDKIPLAASGILESLKKQWPDGWGVRMEHVFRNCLYAVLERDGSTVPDILRLFVDEGFRRGVVAGVRNQVVRRFWTDEFENYPDRLRAEAVVRISSGRSFRIRRCTPSS